MTEVTPSYLRKIVEKNERELAPKYAYLIKEAIIKFLEDQKVQILGLRSIKRNEITPFSYIRTYANLVELSEIGYLADYDIINKPESVIEDTISYLQTKHNIVSKRVKIEDIDDIVFFYDFNEETTAEVQPVYRSITEGKVACLIGAMEEKLIEIAEDTETEYTFVFNDKHGFPYITLAEQRKIIEYFKNKGFTGLDDCGFNFEELDNNQIKISF